MTVKQSTGSFSLSTAIASGIALIAPKKFSTLLVGGWNHTYKQEMWDALRANDLGAAKAWFDTNSRVPGFRDLMATPETEMGKILRAKMEKGAVESTVGINALNHAMERNQWELAETIASHLDPVTDPAIKNTLSALLLEKAPTMSGKLTSQLIKLGASAGYEVEVDKGWQEKKKHAGNHAIQVDPKKIKSDCQISPLIGAVNGGNHEAVKALMNGPESDAPSRERTMEAMAYALAKGDDASVRALLDRIDPNERVRIGHREYRLDEIAVGRCKELGTGSLSTFSALIEHPNYRVNEAFGSKATVHAESHPKAAKSPAIESPAKDVITQSLSLRSGIRSNVIRLIRDRMARDAATAQIGGQLTRQQTEINQQNEKIFAGALSNESLQDSRNLLKIELAQQGPDKGYSW